MSTTLTERADHRAAAAAHRTAAIAHREQPSGTGEQYRTNTAAELSRFAESHHPMGGNGVGRQASQTAHTAAQDAASCHKSQRPDLAIDHHQQAATAHDRAACEHEAVAEGRVGPQELMDMSDACRDELIGWPDTVTCDVCEQSTPSSTVEVGIGDSVICPTCHQTEREAWARLGDRINDALIGGSAVDVAVRDVMLADLIRQHGLDIAIRTPTGPPPTVAEVEQMVAEVAEYLQTDALPTDVQRVYRACC